MEAVSQAQRFWTGFDLSSRRAQMDSQSLEIADQQEAFLTSRKKLAESTKQYKKATPEERNTLVASLIKLYQDEIDALTKRCKASESLFLSLYKDLADAPDPATVISVAMELTKSTEDEEDKEDEVRVYREEVEELRKELAKVKNQDVTIRLLEEQLKEATAKSSSLLQTEIAAREKLWNEEQQNLVQSFKEREAQYQNQLQQKDETVRQNIKFAEDAQAALMEFRLRTEEEREKLNMANDLLVSQNERTMESLLSVERERDKLLSQIESMKQQAQSAAMQKTTELEKELEKQGSQMQELVSQISKLQGELVEEKNKSSVTFEKIHQQNLEISSLKGELVARPTKEQFMELKRKLKLIEALEFSGVIEDEDDGLPSLLSQLSSVESLLLEKHKKSTTELTNVKVQLSELQNQLKEAQLVRQSLQEKTSTQEALIRKLESDLASGYTGGSREVRSVSLSNSDGFSMVSDDTESVRTVESLSAETSQGSRDLPKENKNSILSIITQQRDRFKARVDELELENRKLKDTIEGQKTAYTNLQADNVKLYEKIRYLQTFNSQRGSDIESGDDSVNTKYRALYEESIHPFAQFNSKERQQRYQQLNLAERAILHTSTYLLGHKRTRIFVFCYILLLHFLVFTTVSAFANYTCPVFEAQVPLQ